MNHLIELDNVSKIYKMGSSQVHAMRNVSLKINAGEFVAIMGASGSGKSTLLNMLGFLDMCDSGSYHFMGRDVTNFSEDELSVLRNNVAGFVFQQFQLLPRLSALDNVLLPTIYAGKKNMEQTAEDKLKWVGLGHRIHHSPNELSGGEQQRVAIARAIVTDPTILVADEPTGDLDRVSAEEILAMMERLNSEMGKTIIMVTHDPRAAQRAKIVRHLDKGYLNNDDSQNPL